MVDLKHSILTALLLSSGIGSASSFYSHAQSQETCVEEYLTCLETTGIQWECGLAFEACNGTDTENSSDEDTISDIKICTEWAKIRDLPSTVDSYFRTAKRLEQSIQTQKVWLDRLNELESENYDGKLMMISAMDVFITVLDVTSRTVSSSIDLATLGAGSYSVTYSIDKYREIKKVIDRAELATDLMRSNSVEEAMFAHAKKEISFAGHVASLFTVLDALKNAKERSDDRFAAMETVKYAQLTVEAELEKLESKLAGQTAQMNLVSKFKNDMDGACNK